MLVLILICMVVVALAHGRNGLNCLGGIVRLVLGLMLLLVAASMI
jgi:hypothetical protein